MIKTIDQEVTGAQKKIARRTRGIIISQLSPSAPPTELDSRPAVSRGGHAPRRSSLRTARAGRRDPDLELADALNRSIAGDSDAFAQLYRSTSPRVYGVVSRVLQCPDQAAEVTQEIYLEVWRQAVRYDCTKGGVMTWMTTIAHRRAVDRVRHVSSTRVRDQNYAAATLEQDGDDVWDSVVSRVDATHVRQALARLAPIYQQALGLAYFGGRTQSQIAASLQLPLGTVKTRVRNGLIALRGELLTD